MSGGGPYGQPGYNPQYGNPYGANAPPPAGWTGQQRECFFFVLQRGNNSEYQQPPPMPMHPNMMGGGANYSHADPEANDGYKNMQFSDVTIRAAFIRKVFMLVTIMVSLNFHKKEPLFSFSLLPS